MGHWFRENEEKLQPTLLQRLIIRILQAGDIPNHIAFIMDGNRRYARANKLGNVIVGHEHGFDKFTQVLAWCSYLGVKEVSAYCFSIENFHRPKDEVDGLLNLLEIKFKDLLNEIKNLNEKGIQVNVYGDLTLLPETIQKLIAQVVLQTRSNRNWTLNLYIAYTSTEEMCNAINTLCSLTQPNCINVTESNLYAAFRSHAATKPDLLIRSSGEIRVSNFLTWQCAFTPICFLEEKWPELTIWTLFRATFFYQRYKWFNNLDKTNVDGGDKCLLDNQLVQQLEEKRYEQLKLLAGEQ